MKNLLALAGAHKVVTAIVAVGVVGAGINAVSGGDTTATVTHVVDGDTVDVSYGGETHRVRLLNVNTPESVDLDKPVECLGVEASDYLRSRLPVGTDVRLERDVEERDRYGRELAGVFLDEELINASIAREGLGVPMSVGGNTKFLAAVQTAHDQAQAAEKGLYSSTVTCTLPAQVAALKDASTSVLQEQPTSTAELDEFDAYSGRLLAVLATVHAVSGVLDGAPDAFPHLAHSARQVAELRSRVEVVQTQLDAAKSENAGHRAAEQRRIDDEAERVAEEAARKAAEDAARRAAEDAARRAADEAAQRAAAEAAARAATPRASTPPRRPSMGSTSSGGGSTAGGGSSGGDGYTGCRSYAPGGKTYTPIPC